MNLQDYIAKLKTNPHFARAYEDLGPEMEQERKILRKRIIWQAELWSLLESPKADGLTNRQRRILQWRYGLYDGPALTLKQVEQRLGITRERVRQEEHEALDILGHSRLTYPRL